MQKRNTRNVKYNFQFVKVDKYKDNLEFGKENVDEIHFYTWLRA